MVIDGLKEDLYGSGEKSNQDSLEEENQTEVTEHLLKCEECNFEGKTMQGLKTHITKIHKKR